MGARQPFAIHVAILARHQHRQCWLADVGTGVNASFQEVQWIVLAYLLTITIVIVSVGRLGDIIGRRRLLLAGMFLFTLASVLCGIAPTPWLLFAARAVQGLEDRHLVPELDQVAGASQARRARADDRDLLARWRRHVRLHVHVVRERVVAEEPLEPSDAAGFAALVQAADLLALVLLRADAPADGRQQVHLGQGHIRRLELAGRDLGNERGDVDLDRAAVAGVEAMLTKKLAVTMSPLFL